MNSDVVFNAAFEALSGLCRSHNYSQLGSSAIIAPELEYTLESRVNDNGYLCLVVKPRVLMEYNLPGSVIEYWSGIRPEGDLSSVTTILIPLSDILEHDAELYDANLRAWMKSLVNNGCDTIDAMLAGEAVSNAYRKVAKMIARYVTNVEKNKKRTV